MTDTQNIDITFIYEGFDLTVPIMVEYEFIPEYRDRLDYTPSEIIIIDWWAGEQYEKYIDALEKHIETIDLTDYVEI